MNEPNLCPDLPIHGRDSLLALYAAIAAANPDAGPKPWTIAHCRDGRDVVRFMGRDVAIFERERQFLDVTDLRR